MKLGPTSDLSESEWAELEIEASRNLAEWDKGVFNSKFLSNRTNAAIGLGPVVPPRTQVTIDDVEEAKKTLTETWTRLEQRFGSFFDVGNWESSVPQILSLESKKSMFRWATDTTYPPHLDIIPDDLKVDVVSLTASFLNHFRSKKHQVDAIFDTSGFLQLTGVLVGGKFPVLLKAFDSAANDDTPTIDAIVKQNQALLEKDSGIFNMPNIGMWNDWYSDNMFAQQQFIGANPTTIAAASPDWVQQFLQQAKKQQNAAVTAFITEHASDESLYIQDYSYFRRAIVPAGHAPYPAVDIVFHDDSQHEDTWAVASVCLFHLSPKGVLHPLAIVIDHKGTGLDKSVVIFNKRLEALELPVKPPSPASAADLKEYGDLVNLEVEAAKEKEDWPWRYAKMCVQVSDWVRHENTIHLTNCHLVEEAIIVGAQRSFNDPEHPVFRLISAHWYKTLSLNAAARATLVPEVIVKLVGFTHDQTYNFIKHAYRNFDWTGLYVPTDLTNRGFPIDKLDSDPKYKNYTYARNMILMWKELRAFVGKVLQEHFVTDKDVATDPSIQAWVKEMQDPVGGQMVHFPQLKTVDALIDAVTMCIHIASPQHTAVNYLQSYYQEFVLNRPPGLCTAPPKTLAELEAYDEPKFYAATTAERLDDWLLASHVPHLLSFKVADEQNITNYARSLYVTVKNPDHIVLKQAAGILYYNLKEDGYLTKKFAQNSADRDDIRIPYDVMNPQVTANSILI